MTLQVFIENCKIFWLRHRNFLYNVFLGQCLSVCIALTGFSIESLGNNYNLYTSGLQNLAVYTCLTIIFTLPNYTLLIAEFSDLKTKWKRTLTYFLLSLIDVEANYLIVYAYSLTSILFIQILDCTVIPWSMLFSFFLLKIRYRLFNYLGCIAAIAGAACLLLSQVFYPENDDTENKEDEFNFSKELLGDFLIIISSALYAASNVLQEFLVKYDQNGIQKVRAFYGFFGPIIVIIQILATKQLFSEVNDLRDFINNNGAYNETLTSTNDIIAVSGYNALFVFAMILIYFIMPITLENASAVFLNLSMLTADVYALIIGIFVFDSKLTWLYIVGFLVIDSGIVLYNHQTPFTKTKTDNELSCELDESENLSPSRNKSFDADFSEKIDVFL